MNQSPCPRTGTADAAETSAGGTVTVIPIVSAKAGPNPAVPGLKVLADFTTGSTGRTLYIRL